MYCSDFFADIHDPQRLNPTEFDDPLTISLELIARQNVCLSSQVSQQLLDVLL